MMKQSITGLLIAAMLLTIGTITSFAAGSGKGCNFIDRNGDGICDYAKNTCLYTDADGDGICDHCGRKEGTGLKSGGRGRNLIDEDGDGICDYYAAGIRPQDGTGRKNGFQGERNR